MAFKDKYVIRGVLLTPSGHTGTTPQYLTNKIGASGDGGYTSPMSSAVHINPGYNVLSGGVHIDISGASGGGHLHIVGNGAFNTHIINLQKKGWDGLFLKDLSIDGALLIQASLNIASCVIYAGTTYTWNGGAASYPVIYKDILSFRDIREDAGDAYTNVSIVDVGHLLLTSYLGATNSIFENSNIVVSTLGNATNYLAFAKCNFRIGSETAFTALIGSNADARKANFIARCEAQGIVCPSVSDLGVTAKLQRWDFDDQSIVGGAVIDGSLLAVKNAKRGFYMGYTKPIRTIPLSTESTTLGHISENNTGFEVSGDALFVDEKIVMTAPNALSIDSSVIPLDGRMQLDALDVVHTFSGVYGIHLRDGASDIASQNIALLRTVDALPPAKIRTGALLASFWYLVTYDTPEVKETGYIEYNGKRHYCGDAILVKAGVTAFTIPASFANKVHLRECWHTNFAGGKNPNNESAAFWGGEKLKPNWLPVVLDDLRAQFKNDNESTGTIKEVGGVPMTSGVKNFYPQILDGVPVFPLYGSFVQIRINAMTGDERISSAPDYTAKWIDHKCENDREVYLSADVESIETGGTHLQWDAVVTARRAVASNLTIHGATIFISEHGAQLERKWMCTILKGATTGRNPITTINETEGLTSWIESIDPASDAKYDYIFYSIKP